jgi:predicted dehydrogenase
MSRLRIGLLGCGGIAARHASAVKALHEEMELVACCGRDVERTEAFAAAHGGAACVELDRMLDMGIDLIVVALPPYVRSGEIERIAAAGTHLLVEKPIALDEATAARLVEAVEKAGVRAAVGFMYRFGDAVSRWRESDAGRVELFTASYHCNALHAPWWRERAKSGGQMIEQAIHLVDLVRLFMGEPDRVYARAANLLHRDVPGYDVEDVSAMLFSWDDGRIATLNASNMAVPGRWQKEWSLFADRMTGRFSNWNNAVFTRTVGDVADETVAGTTDPFVAQLADLAGAIRQNRAPRIPLSEGLLTLRLALAARRSADEKREVRLR